MREARPPLFGLVFIVSGAWLIGRGLCFIFLRPALLPKDLRDKSSFIVKKKGWTWTCTPTAATK